MAKVANSASAPAKKKSVANKVKQATKSGLAVGKDSVALKKDDDASKSVSAAATTDVKNSKRKSATELMDADEAVAPKKSSVAKKGNSAVAGEEEKQAHMAKRPVTGSKASPVSSGKVVKAEAHKAAEQQGKTKLKSALKSKGTDTAAAATVKSKTAANTKKNEKVQVAPSAAEKGKAASKKEKTEAKSKSSAAAADKMEVDVESDDDDDDFIHGFSSSEDEEEDAEDSDNSDSDDEEDLKAAEKKRSVDVPSLPSKATDDKSVKRRLDAAKRNNKNEKERGVLYLGRIPHGFYEEEMKEYFTQFGEVTRLRLARNKKTGASKHFAYLEFAQKSVAEITAETMNNYLLLGHLLQCHLVSAEKLHPDLWVGANRKWRKVPALRIERATYGKERTKEQSDKADRKLVQRDQERKRKIKDLGIDYEYEGFSKK